MKLSADKLQTLLESAMSNFSDGDLPEARRELIRAQRELENIDEIVWRFKSQISATLAE